MAAAGKLATEPVCRLVTVTLLAGGLVILFAATETTWLGIVLTVWLGSVVVRVLCTRVTRPPGCDTVVLPGSFPANAARLTGSEVTTLFGTAETIESHWKMVEQVD